MPVLSNPTMNITLVAGTTQARVTAGVRVSFDPFEENLIKLLGLKFRLGCRIMGEDSGFNGADDSLFSIASKVITSDGTQTFTRTVNRASLDEDWEGNDEIFARFTCQSTTPSFPLPASPVQTVPITGNF